MKHKKFKNGFTKRGQLLVLVGFLVAIGVGAVLLRLPFMSKGDLKWTDAFFVATSAVCVTGLSPVGIANFSIWGQAVVLVLIQLGGLGIITLSTALLLAFGGGLSFGDSLMISNLNERFSLRGTESLLWTIVFYTFVVETAGFLLMLPGMLILNDNFKSPTGCLVAVGESIFLSVSSFCNAGFSPVTDSLRQVSRWVQFVSLLLMITGGIGIYVVYDLKERVFNRRRPKPLGGRHLLWIPAVLLIFGALGEWLFSLARVGSRGPFAGLLLLIAAGVGIYVVHERRASVAGQRYPLHIHSKLVLWTTGGLLVFGAVFAYCLCRVEAKDISGFDALFLSATARTCGFYTVPLAALPESVQTLLLYLMLIGGSPGGTAGGIKTSTVALVVVAILSVLRGDSEVMLFNRRIPTMNVLRGFTIILIFTVLAGVGAVFLQSWETGLDPQDVAFEAISALTTTGLSIGNTTSRLSDGGKWLLVLFMFLGRVGPFSVLGFLLGREKHSQIQYPEERIIIG